MNLNEIANELPHFNKVQFSGVKINEFLPVISLSILNLRF